MAICEILPYGNVKQNLQKLNKVNIGMKQQICIKKIKIDKD